MLVASQRHLLFKWPHPGSAFRGSDVFCFLLKNEEEEEEEEEDHKEERGKHPRGGRRRGRRSAFGLTSHTSTYM